VGNVGNRDEVGGPDTEGEVERRLSPRVDAHPCPKCGEPLTTLWLEGEWQFYRCEQHGIVVLTPGPGLSSDEPDDSKVRR
jgi:hypothetical protein